MPSILTEKTRKINGQPDIMVDIAGCEFMRFLFSFCAFLYLTNIL